MTASGGVRTSTLRENCSGSLVYTWRTIRSRVRPALRGPGSELAGDPGRDVVEAGPAGAEEVEPALQVACRQDVDLDLGRHVGETPEVGRARPGDALDHIHVA